MVASGPFDFDLCSRNAYLESKGIKPPRFTKTGTTIVGLIYKVWRKPQRPLRALYSFQASTVHC